MTSLAAAVFPLPSRLLLNRDHRHDAFTAAGHLRIGFTSTNAMSSFCLLKRTFKGERRRTEAGSPE